ncbi:transcription-repair coupling factor [Eubacteriales bacterium OttesenSCG-928-K08]|nr:transcription-repair coupling factor [Eubacteriales bacterium OttesenSCG-928-K08]
MRSVEHPLLSILKELPEYNRLNELITGAGGPAAAFGLPEAHRAHVFAALSKGRGGFFVCATAQAAQRVFEQALALGGNVALLPPREIPLVNAYAAEGESAKIRMTTLTRLALGEPVGVVMCAEAALQTLAPPDVLRSAVKRLAAGDVYAPRQLLSDLLDAGYEPVDAVEGRQQASLRGDILDVFPPHAEYPFRLEFFDDEIDRLSIYDPDSQRSISNVEEVILPPATEVPQSKETIIKGLAAIKNARGFDAQRISFEQNRPSLGAEILLPVFYPPAAIFDYADALLFFEEPARILEEAEAANRLFIQSVSAMLERGEGLEQQAGLLQPPTMLRQSMGGRRTALFYSLARQSGPVRAKETLQFDSRPAPQFMGDRRELARDVELLKRTGNAVVLYAGAQAERLKTQLLDEGLETAWAAELTRLPVKGEALLLPQSLPLGFSYPSLHLSVLSESEINGFAKQPARLRRSQKSRPLYSDLRPGDYVVHEAHGVGRFLGVEALEVQNTTRDYLLMEYLGGDRLYIPTDQLDRVQKYIGADEGAPKLSKLGGSDWQRQVSKAKSAVKELAFDLAKLYAEREQSRGFAFSPDSRWQLEMEARFPYTETPDQAQSIMEIKRDMESTRAMDRLLCGDVGYGKTEVALRAAFKAVQDSKQVAFLVPTTILAQQHYNTLSTRFADFPVKVALLSRFKTAQENKRTKESLALGQIDIVVATHALLAKDVRFKDLGLLVIDEEQRFGVGHKEQIKTMKQNVDVLTLTATPIPRTLHMSMIGIRDMSIIDTPPEERFPVQTYVLEYSDTLIRDAANKELNRGGQVYIVYNNVRRMDIYAGELRALIPEARIACAHGQMPEAQLEATMLAFLEGEYNILLCSTIIENGLDIPNVNTLIVVEADKMGLAQLYQLRGRVGRSSRLGYAYFTFARNRSISEIAQKRLNALTEFAQFGAGKEIALRDLEIRGAGSLLGAHQHGHIADVGYEYYCKLMAGAVKQTRGEENDSPDIDTVVDVPIDANIPKSYIRNEVQRLSMYKRIALISDRLMLMDVQEEIEDRFGDIPEATQNLLDVSLVKAYCIKAQINSLTIRDGSAKFLFHPDATPDGARLLAVAAEYGAQLAPGDVVSLLLKREKYDAKKMLEAAQMLLASFTAGV